MNIGQNKWIYFLSFGEKLPENFYRLSFEFTKLGHMLLPVKAHQIHNFLSEQNCFYLISVVSNISEQEQFKKDFSSHLNYLVTSNRISLFHISSFSSAQFKQRQKNYYYMSLPISYGKIIETVRKSFETSKKEQSKWPGGRRAKLPVGI